MSHLMVRRGKALDAFQKCIFFFFQAYPDIQFKGIFNGGLAIFLGKSKDFSTPIFANNFNKQITRFN